MKSKIKPNLLHNILALSSVQALGYILPLITLPYVTRVLGVEAWGSVALVQVILSYFTLATNWGFNLSGTRKIAAHRNEIEKISKIFISTWLGQWILCTLACTFLILLVIFIPFFEKYSIYYHWGIGIVVGNVLFPIWFFNGLERMKELALIQILTRFTSVPLIFIFIKGPTDAPLILAISSLISLISGMLSMAWIIKKLNLSWKIPNLRDICNELREGWALFASTLWVSLYTTITPVILGSISGVTEVGYYIFAERFKSLAQSILGPISQSLYPRLSHLYKYDFNEARSLLIKSGKIIISISLALSIGLWVMAPDIVILMGGESFRPAIEVLRWLSALPFIISLSNIFGVQVMLANHKNSAVNWILAFAGIFSLGILIPLIYLQGAVGASISTLIVELFVTVSFIFYVIKYKILNIKY